MPVDLTTKEIAEDVAVRTAVLMPHSVETSGLYWLAVHGALSLGLRHPRFAGPSRQLVESFRERLGEELVHWGVLTAEELAAAEGLERRESPHG
jgi:hypothetical protein